MSAFTTPESSPVRRIAALFGAAVLVVCGVIGSGGPAFAGTTTSAPHVVTFTTSGNWTVPLGVSVVSVTVTGGGGGNDPDDAVGGMGAVVTGDLAVVPGRSFTFVVGEAGGNGRNEGSGFTNGGHGGGSGGCGNSGAGGGGSTGFYEGAASYSPLIVAGAGGGGGGWAGGAQGGTGGWADIDNAGTGQSDAGKLGQNPGNGAGGPGDSSNSCAGGGGGGGGFEGSNGYYGGGTGGSANYRDSGGGGGGGSSFADPFVTNLTFGSATDPSLGGSVVVSYVQAPYSTIGYTADSTLSVPLEGVFAITPAITTSNGQAPAGTVSLIDSSSSTVLASQDAAAAGPLSVWSSAVGTETVHLAFSSADDVAIPSSVSPDFTLTTTKPVSAIHLTADNLGWSFTDGTLTADLYGAAVSLPMPTGTVGFYDGGTLIATATLNAGSFATIPTMLSGGTHDLTVQYSGDAVYAASVSDVLTVTTQSSIVPIVSGGGGLFPPAGSPIDLTISGSAGAALPQTGSIRFLFDGALITETVKDDADGSRRVSIPAAAVTEGDHIITLEYSYGGAAPVPISEPLTVSVRKATVTATPPPRAGEATALAATGSNPLGWAALAGSILLAGLALVRIRRRRANITAP